MKLIVSVLFTLAILTGAAHAQQPFQAIKGDSVETPAGRFSVRKESNPVCSPDSCSVVRLGQTILGNNWTAGLVGAYPSLQAPVLVSYFTHGGGNCCLPGVAIVDVGTTPFFDLGGLFLLSNLPGPTVKETGAGLYELTGDNYEQNKLGDRVPTTYIYDRKRKLVWEKPEQAAPDLSPLIGKYPHDFLSDTTKRAPLVRMVGEASFKEFRDHIGVAGPMELMDRRWLVGRGCQPHSCGSREGYFAIDLRTGKMVALQFDISLAAQARPRVSIWSDIPPEAAAELYSLRASINGWLKPTGASLRTEPGPFRVNNPRNSANDGSPSHGSARSRPAEGGQSVAPPVAFSDQSTSGAGPSFDCGAKAVSSQPLAQMICSNRELAYTELSYVIAYQALRESRDAEQRKTMVADANALVVTLIELCGIPKTGTIQRGPNAQEVTCIKGQFQRQRLSLIAQTSGAARDEAILEPADTIAIQRALQIKQYLPPSATLDGVFGPMSRAAIVSWQRASGLPESGYGSKPMLLQLTSGTATPTAPEEPRMASSQMQIPRTPRVQIDNTGKTASIQLALGDGSELKAREVFERVSAAVFVVHTETALGSAVAVGEHELLTNCHVLGMNTEVILEQNARRNVARLSSSNSTDDRCVLTSATPLQKWVRVRPFSDIKVGERAFSIAAPQGFDLTIAEGIVSSKRVIDGDRLLQTSAPISKGSSGGGLFDGQGHLLGITTWMRKDAQNLNFAIAAEEYAK